MKFSLKLALSIFLTGTVVLLIISMATYEFQSRSLVRSASKSGEHIADAIAQNLEQILIEKTKTAWSMANSPTIQAALVESNASYTALGEKGRRDLIEQFDAKWQATTNSHDPFILEYTDNKASRYFKSQQATLRAEYGEIFLTNRFGAIVASTAKLTTFAHRHKYWWQGAYKKGEGAVFFDDRGFDDSVGGYVLGVVVPVIKNNRILGILKCNVNIQGAVSELMAKASRTLPGQFKLVRTGGAIVFEPGSRPLSTKVTDELQRKLSISHKDSMVFEDKGRKWLAGFSEIRFAETDKTYRFGGSTESIDHKKGNKGEAWHIIHLKSMETILQPLLESTKKTVIAASGIILALMIVTYLLGRRLALPLINLNHKIEQISEGQFGVQIHSKRKDEFGLLYDSFDHMSDKLASTTTSLDALEAEVERRKASESEKQQIIIELKNALAEVKTLSGLLPICSYCKKIRDDQGYWNRLEAYIQRHSDAELSHGICPACARKYHPDIKLYDD